MWQVDKANLQAAESTVKSWTRTIALKECRHTAAQLAPRVGLEPTTQWLKSVRGCLVELQKMLVFCCFDHSMPLTWRLQVIADCRVFRDQFQYRGSKNGTTVQDTLRLVDAQTVPLSGQTPIPTGFVRSVLPTRQSQPATAPRTTLTTLSVPKLASGVRLSSIRTALYRLGREAGRRRDHARHAGRQRHRGP